MTRAGRLGGVAALLVAAACSADAPTSSPPVTSVTSFVPVTSVVPGTVPSVRSVPTVPPVPITLPLADEALDDPEVTTVASNLAPSQIAGSTVPVPVTPQPCAVDDLDVWTAHVRPHDGTVDAIIRIRNVGDTWCEADVGRSPLLDPAIEPDVWLLPDGTADLVVGQTAATCDDPMFVSQIQIGIGGESLFVPSAVVTCGWWLTALAPNEPIAEACDAPQVEVTVAGNAVVVRNSSGEPCRLGGVVRVDGAEIRRPEPDRRPQAISELMPGDVVAFGSDDGAACAGSKRVVLHDAVVGALMIDEVPCALVFESGGGRPWYGTIDDPSTRLDVDVVDWPTLLDALDPFGGSVVG